VPSSKTETTELAVAFGLLGIQEPDRLNEAEAAARFNGTLTAEKFQAFLTEFDTRGADRTLYRQMHAVGLRLREADPALSSLGSLRWTGPEQQASTATMARDIQAGYISISVKAQSDVVANPSPYNLLRALPSGEQPGSRSDHWYRSVAPVPYQALYDLARGLLNMPGLPDDVSAYDSETSGAERREVAHRLGPLLISGGEAADRFQSAYLRLSRAVAIGSADRFNASLARAMRTKHRSAVLERIAQIFFRLDSAPYILAGIDRGRPFALRVPDITTWCREWSFEIRAHPDLSAGQPVVRFDFTATPARGGAAHLAPFHTQIRWSHGKFCGNPEGKLYKDFAWADLPFMEVLFAG